MYLCEEISNQKKLEALLTENQKEVPKAERHSKEFSRIKLGIFLTGLSVFAQLYLFQPLLPELTRYYNITPEHSSFSVSAATVGMAVGLFIFAFVADRISRKKLMVSSIITASLLTIVSAFSPDFTILILFNFLKGICLSGVTAVALAYLAEEVNPAALGIAIGLYLSGNTIGGMSGRVFALLISGYLGWHYAVLILGGICLVLGIVFAKIFPDSKHFSPQPVHFKNKITLMLIFLKDHYMQGIYFIGFSVMGIFVSIYNYLGFRLEAPPFSFPHSIIACIFLMYIFGVFGSMAAGKLSDKLSSKKIIWRMVVALIIGLLLMLTENTWITIFGMGMITFFFFASHTLASRMISQRAVIGKSMATCLYYLFYYIGSSIVGSSTGKMLSHFGWTGFVIGLIALGFVTLLVALWIRFHRPKNLHLYQIHK